MNKLTPLSKTELMYEMIIYEGEPCVKHSSTGWWRGLLQPSNPAVTGAAEKSTAAGFTRSSLHSSAVSSGSAPQTPPDVDWSATTPSYITSCPPERSNDLHTQVVWRKGSRGGGGGRCCLATAWSTGDASLQLFTQRHELLGCHPPSHPRHTVTRLPDSSRARRWSGQSRDWKYEHNHIGPITCLYLMKAGSESVGGAYQMTVVTSTTNWRPSCHQSPLLFSTTNWLSRVAHHSNAFMTAVWLNCIWDRWILHDVFMTMW